MQDCIVSIIIGSGIAGSIAYHLTRLDGATLLCSNRTLISGTNVTCPGLAFRTTSPSASPCIKMLMYSVSLWAVSAR